MMHNSGATPEHTAALTLEQVSAARKLLHEIVPVSRLIRSVYLSNATGANVFLKLECEGPTGSFKLRGAYHAIWSRLHREKFPGVVTSSTGNHGAATAFAAKRLGLPVRIYLPKNPNPTKRDRIAQLGAEIIEVGEFLEETRKYAAKFAEESGWFNLGDGIEADMLPGTATITAEIIEQLPEVDAIFVPVGDSTLIRGAAFGAKSLKPAVRVIGVQAEKAPAYALAFEKGHGLSTDSSDTIADGLSVRDALEENVREIRKLVDGFTLVSESEMLAAIRDLYLNEKVLAEPAGAATTAALLKISADFKGKTVALLVTGANIAEEHFQQALKLP
jgi:threonine dehydratase